MDIAIRPRLSRDDVEALLRERLGGDVAVAGHEEFKDGYFNAAHGVVLADGRELVVKVAPDRGLKLLRYEVDLMATEIEFFERAGAAGVPVPRLWHGDGEAGVVVMDRLRGTPLSKAGKAMSRAELLAVRKRLGRLGARVGTVRGEHFGYPRKDRHTWSDSWGESFLTMAADVLADIRELEVALPRGADEIERLFAAHRPLLDDVAAPVLVHFDLWDGNVFVHRTAAGWAIEGIIDGERAFYGDPIAELVSLRFESEEESEAVVDGFLGRPLTDEEDRRLRLYQVYLWLILVAEPAVRGFEAEVAENQFKWATGNLVRDLALLDD